MVSKKEHEALFGFLNGLLKGGFIRRVALNKVDRVVPTIPSEILDLKVRQVVRWYMLGRKKGKIY